MGDAIQQLTAAIQQLLANQNAAPAANAHALPTLPTIDCFEPSDDRSISDWLERFNFALDCAAPQLADQAKVKLLMTKLSEVAFSQYSKSCLPKKVIDFDFSQTEERLKIAFSRPQSIWIDRYECLRASKSEDESFRPFINRHKRLLRDFQFDKLNEEQFSCLMLLTALKSPKDAELRKRILSKLAADGDFVEYDGVVEDLQMYQSTIAEAKVLEQQPMGSRYLMATKLKAKKKRTNSDLSSNASSISTGTRSSNRSQCVCWRCGLSHSSRNCRHETTVCRKCKKSGHLERMCAKHQAWLKKNGGKNEKAANNVRVGGVYLVKSENQRKNGIIDVPIDVNGTKVDFIADFGTEGTVLCEDTVRQIGALKLSRSQERAQYHDGTIRPFVGKGKATFSFGNRSAFEHFFVSKDGSKNLLGLDMMDRLGLSDSIRNGLKDKFRTETAKANGESQNKKKFFRKDRRGKKQNFFAVGANVIASLGDESWRAGRVISRKEGTYDVQFLDGTTGEFPAKGVQPYKPDEDENLNFLLDGFGLKRASSGGSIGKHGSDGRRDQTKDDLREASDCGHKAKERRSEDADDGRRPGTFQGGRC
ncbi:hypothetical protein niasHT_038892 [Heterodera trifolii]|uniref:CCHC-type domain-containing protein n=1 Tax=Heterodera trifolii TaxID=157864 RepID=A0ABD2IS88_9BILA